jgi:small subunit ribosomal protein S2
MKEITFEELLEAGVHFGHLRSKWNPAMAPYIFKEVNGIHIIDLEKTIEKLKEAGAAIKQIAKSGKKILFVATKKQAKEIIAQKAQEVGMPYITERWMGGMLTNFQTIRRTIRRIDIINKMEKEGTFEKISKKERLRLIREREKLQKRLGSIKDMNRLPAAIYIVDINKEKIAVAEAKKLHIPIFAIVDTNTDPRGIDFPIPANDDASESIAIITDYLVQAIKEGLEERKIELEKKKAEKVAAEKEKSQAAETPDRKKPSRRPIRRK